jgi:uncharacterized coiled-coil protein SlyX
VKATSNIAILPLVSPMFVLGLVQRMVAAVVAEKQQPCSSLSAEQAQERAWLHGYLQEGRYLESTQRLFIRLFQTGQVQPHEMQTVIHHERGAAGDSLRHQIAELERKVAQQQTTSDEIAAGIEQRHQQLGQLLMECGKRMKYRDLPLSIFYKDLFPWLFTDTDLYDIKAGRANWDTASSAFSSEGLIVAIVYATYLEQVGQMLKQERDIAAEQVWRYKLEAEDARRDQREACSRYYQSKEHLEEAERELARYRQLCDLNDRQCLQAQAAALGAQIGYQSLLAVNPSIRAGEEAWNECLQQADNEDLVRIIALARHFAENLIWLKVHDELQRAQRRIAELECQVEHNQMSAVSSQPGA